MIRHRFRSLIVPASLVAVGLPLDNPAAGRGFVREAACAGTTCCKESEAECIKCVVTCIVVENAYDRGGGSCNTPPVDNP